MSAQQTRERKKVLMSWTGWPRPTAEDDLVSRGFQGLLGKAGPVLGKK